MPFNRQNSTLTKAIWILAYTAVPISLTASLPALGDTGTFYERKAEGWFFYEPEPLPPEPVPEPEPEPEPKAVVIAPPTEAPPEDVAGALEATPPAPFSTVWIRENLPKYQEAALDDPTNVEKAAAVAFVKRLALDKAEQFTHTHEKMMLKYPILDESTNRSQSSFATKAMDSSAASNADRLLTKIANNTLGLFYFFEGDCPVCVAQTSPLRSLVNRYKFSIQPISLDGSHLPVKGYENFKIDQGQARVLGVVKAPAIYLVVTPDQILSLGQGGTSASDLNKSLLLQAQAAGVITDEEYQSTRTSSFNPLQLIANQRARGGSDLHDSMEGDTGYIDPELLIKGVLQ